MDLVLELAGGRTWTVEVKRTASPRYERGFRSANEVLESDRSFIVYPGEESFPVAEGVQAISLAELCAELAVA